MPAAEAERELRRTPLPRRWVHSRRLGLRDLGLAIAELRQMRRDLRGAREVYQRALEDMDRAAEESANNAFRHRGDTV
jgi:hypothetical protein